MNTYSKIITTDRMYLREMDLLDNENLQQIFSDPIAMQYYPKTLNIKETQSWIQQVMLNYGKHGVGLWACHLKENDQFVGQCGLVFQYIEGKEMLEVGYLFVRKYWNQGLATEAAKACMDYAKDKLGMKKIISLIKKENLASRKVAEKNGLVAKRNVMFKGEAHMLYEFYF